MWNTLPEIVISAGTTDTFKRLDKFRKQDILYDYKVKSRSQINANDNIVT